MLLVCTDTDPALDVDVSYLMDDHGIVEGKSTHYWAWLTHGCCATGGLVLDVGVHGNESSPVAVPPTPL